MNVKYVVSRLIVTVFMAGAAAVSFGHIVDVSHTLGLGWEAWTVPFLIDGIAVLGLIGRGREFAAGTRRAGLALTVGAGALSLACNVMAGDNLGQQLYGALVVVGFIATEWYATRLAKAPAPTPITDPRRSAAARKGAATKAANRAAAAKASTRRARAPRDSADAARMLAAAGVAPISPA